jgi:hypothetical protein
MGEERTPSGQVLELRSYGGAAGPEGLAAAVGAVNDLPGSARDDLWTLLEPNLGLQIDDDVEEIVDAFCAKHGVSVDALVPVAQGCRRLFHQAAGIDLSLEEFCEDLNALGSLSRASTGALIACYVKALPFIRSQLVLQTLADFGNVLEDARFRISYLSTTSHQADAVLPVVQLALRYSENGETKRLHVQIAPDVLTKMKVSLDRLVKVR